MKLTDKSLLAATQASEATAELLRYTREGPAGFTAFSEIDVVGKLTEALVLAIDLELNEIDGVNPGEAAALRALQSTAKSYIAGWTA